MRFRSRHPLRRRTDWSQREFFGDTALRFAGTTRRVRSSVACPRTDFEASGIRRLRCKQRHRRARNLPGVVVRIRTDAERTDDRQPARDAASDQALGNADADLRCDALDHAQRHVLDQEARADLHDDVAHRLRGGMAEQAIQHARGRQLGADAVGGRDVRDHLALDAPDRDELGHDREPADRARRQRKRAGRDRGPVGGRRGDRARALLRTAALVLGRVRHLAGDIEHRARQLVGQTLRRIDTTGGDVFRHRRVSVA